MTLAAFSFWLGLAISPAYLALTNRPDSALRSLVKTLPLALFALAAWLSGAPAFLTAALVFSALGDLALSRSGRMAFLYGLCSFALGHLTFILLFLGLGAAPAWEAFVLAPIPAVVLLLVSLSSELWLAPHAGAMKWPVRVYVCLITLMGLFAMALPAGHGQVALGAGLFILSDLILSIRLFRLTDTDPRAAPAGLALWIFYIAGQALIVLGIAPL